MGNRQMVYAQINIGINKGEPYKNFFDVNSEMDPEIQPNTWASLS